MRITYLGHSAFQLALESGMKIVFDPYTAGAFDSLSYDPIEGAFDVAVVSHGHDDHVCGEVLSRSKRTINKSGKLTFEGIVIESLVSYHDDAKGSKRGRNLISVVEAEKLRVAHFGDLGHEITAKAYPMLTKLDVMMVPVGGHFTIDAAAAARLVKVFAPRIVIPMHYLTPKVNLPITPVESFTKLMDNIERSGASEMILTKATLPKEAMVVVLEPAN